VTDKGPIERALSAADERHWLHHGLANLRGITAASPNKLLDKRFSHVQFKYIALAFYV